MRFHERSHLLKSMEEEERTKNSLVLTWYIQLACTSLSISFCEMYVWKASLSKIQKQTLSDRSWDYTCLIRVYMYVYMCTEANDHEELSISGAPISQHHRTSSQQHIQKRDSLTLPNHVKKIQNGKKNHCICTVLRLHTAAKTLLLNQFDPVVK